MSVRQGRWRVLISLEWVGDTYGRTDEFEPVREADLRERLRADCTCSQPRGEVPEEPLKSRGRRDNKQSSGFVSYVLKRMWCASRPERHTAGGCPKDFPARLESEISLEDEPEFVVAAVGVQRRALLGSDDEFDHGH
jgi:hypothetical protein